MGAHFFGERVILPYVDLDFYMVCSLLVCIYTYRVD